MQEDKYDSLIKEICGRVFPGIDWLVVKAQMWQESRFNHNAQSTAKCKGLMQISEPLARERLKDPILVWDPKTNITLGVTYLKEQYDRFPEIPDHSEKIKFSLASYNCGRGYVNKALSLAREAEARRGQGRYDHTSMALSLAREAEGKSPGEAGNWQLWAVAKHYLRNPRCIVNGKRPDANQVLDYVENIMHQHRHYKYLSAQTTLKA